MNSLSEIFLKPAQNESELVQDFDYQLLPLSGDGKSQYLIFKRDLVIHYMDILAAKDNLNFKKLSIDLDTGLITQILPTSSTHIVQFVYTQAKPLQHFVFTWDLEKNMEVQMHTFKVSALIPHLTVTRGNTTRENYFLPLMESNLYDLRFQFPVNFFDGH